MVESPAGGGIPLMRLLLIEDERKLSAALCKLLQQEQYVVDAAYTGPQGLDAGLSGIYDAIILDVMLPGMDGVAVLSALRREGVTTPVLMLTARGDLDDRVRGLETGADYYLPKPFEKSELLACLHALTRRRDTVLAEEPHYGDLSLSRDQVQCSRTGRSVKLGVKEYQLMELFLRNAGQVLPRETLVERVWGMEDDAEYNQLAVYLTFLRRKLTFIGSQVEIRALRGVGYSLEEKHD